eukprot:m.338849 g.338849  ORF g.338849 m.338849 type:complete len:339 (+) comp18565_c0_seq1:100-1116(+)
MQLEDIVALIRERRNGAKDVDNDQDGFWSRIFQSFFIEEECHADDLLIFVKKDGQVSNANTSGKSAGTTKDSVLDVHRRGSTTRKMPDPGDPVYNWEETTCLNLLLQQVEYHMVCAICKRDPNTKKLKVLHRLTNQVYASPSKRSMETKIADEIITFPFLYFSIDDFDQRFQDVVVAPDQCVCVELVGDMGTVRSTIFSGAVTHQQLAASFSSKSGRSRIHAGKSKKNSKMEFLHMRGPKGIGHAEMAVSIADLADQNANASKNSGLSGALKKMSMDTFAFVKDLASGGKDAEGCHLNAYLTFVSLSWQTMTEALTQTPQKPSLDNRPIKSDIGENAN